MIVRVDSLTIQTQLHRRTSTTVAQLTGIRTANRNCHNRRALRRITAQSALTLFLRRHPWALYKGFKGFKGCPALPQHRMRRSANDRSANGTLPCVWWIRWMRIRRIPSTHRRRTTTRLRNAVVPGLHNIQNQVHNCQIIVFGFC